MHTEQEMFNLILNVAKNDERIRAVKHKRNTSVIFKEN